MKLKSLAIMLCLSFCPLFAGEEVKIDVESYKILTSQWLDFSLKETVWIKNNQDDEKQLFSMMDPDQAVNLVRKKMLEIHKNAHEEETSVAYLRYHSTPDKYTELYQVKVFFYLGARSGAALCESFLVTEKGGVLLQRRGAAEK